MRTPAYYRVRATVRAIVWVALAVLALHAIQALIWLAWVGTA